ncbi:MAG TPA: ABC transporter permease subunit [Propionibacteriaceae bacterium]|nr:ABC transporter permease subunit [Propionibacteriaceae bacterium]
MASGTQVPVEAGAPTRPDAKPPGRRARPGTTTTTGLIIKIVLLGLVLALAIFGAFPLIDQGQWLGLALLVGVTALLFWIYLSPRRIPAKYLIPGTLFLLAFQVFPVLYTMSTAFTNFGDAHRGSKEDAIRAIEGASVTKVPGSADYRLSVATEGDPATGDLVFLLTDAETKQPFVGTTEGLEELPAGDVQLSPEGNITQAPGYTILSLGQAGMREEDLADFSVPTDQGAIVNAGLTRAFEGAPQRAYETGCDCIKDQETGQTWTADDSDGLFVDANGDNLAQGWQINVGLRNFIDVVTDPLIAKYFFRTLIWNFAFAILTVAFTFSLGLLVAIVLNHERLKGQRLYRSLLILPYAMPGFVMLLIWRDMFNTDFGLINRLFNSEVNWFGTPLAAMVAVLLVQIWMGYPYMFLVATGALQSIPGDLKEAASVDGAKPVYAFRTIIFPLLLVALAPLMIASFAFNFNNFNAIYLVSEGGPFPADNPQIGATDLLITYTYRLAFGAQGAQYGFAAAVSIFIFLIVAVISIIGFRRTRALEEIN